MSSKRFKSENGDSKSLVVSRGSGSGKGKTLYDEAVILQGHQGPVLSARFNRDGTKIVSGGADKNINLWKLPTDQHEVSPNYGVLQGHKSAVTSLRWAEDDSTIISASADGTIGVWDSESGQRIRKLQAGDGAVNEVSATASGSTVVSGGDDGTVRLWDTRVKTPVGQIETEYPVMATIFNNRETTLYFGGIDPSVNAYDVRILDKSLWKSGGHADSITSLALNSDDSVLLSRSMDGVVKTHSAMEHVPEGISRLNPYPYEGAPSGKEYQLIKACFSTNNVKILSGSEDTTVTAWDFGSRQIVNKYLGHQGCVVDVNYHPSEDVIVSTSTDGSIIVREV